MKTLFVTACGLASSLATAAGLWLVEVYTGWALYSVSFCFVFPVGAIGAGFLAAAGYYAGARLVGRRPGPVLLLNIAVVSALTYFAIRYLTYDVLTVSGVRVRDVLTFPEYLDYEARTTSLQILNRSTTGRTPQLGRWGYARAALQIAGFAVGGVVVFGCLAVRPFCETCGRYLTDVGRRTRYSGDGDEVLAAVHRLNGLLAAGRPADAVTACDGVGHPGPAAGRHLRLRLDIKRCRGCGTRWGEVTVCRHDGKNWAEMTELTARRFMPDEGMVPLVPTDG